MRNNRLSAIIFITLLTLMACGQKEAVSVHCPDLAQGCSVEGLKVSTNQHPQILQPFELRIELDGDGVNSPNDVYASFGMDGMEMGLNRYKLIEKTQHVWIAEVTLPVCVRGRADWVMEIESKTSFSAKRYLVSFQTN